MTVEELRLFIFSIANKDQTGNLPTPEQYNVFLARAVEDKFRLEYGLRQVDNGVYYQNSQNSTDALSKFITVTPTVALLPGTFVLPANYVHLSSLSHIDDGKYRVITVLNEDEWNNRLSNPITPPTLKYPIAKFVAGTLIVYPTTIASVNIAYLRKPVNPVWGSTIVNDEPVYNAATSTQIEFPDIYHIDIARIILSYLGIEFKDMELLQYAEMGKNTGQ